VAYIRLWVFAKTAICCCGASWLHRNADQDATPLDRQDKRLLLPLPLPLPLPPPPLLVIFKGKLSDSMSLSHLHHQGHIWEVQPTRNHVTGKHDSSGAPAKRSCRCVTLLLAEPAVQVVRLTA
jgi:hypothetical protein